MRKEEDEDQRVRNLFREITKLLPERSKIKTDLLYFKYAPILVMLFRWYSVSQFYDSKMEITLWYEENEEPIWFFYFITYILYPISLWKGQVLHRLCVEWRIPLLYAAGVNVIHIMFGSIVITNNMYYCGVLTKWANLSLPSRSMFTMARYPKASMTSSGMRRSGISRLSDTLPTRRHSSASYHESTASTFSNRYTLYI